MPADDALRWRAFSLCIPRVFVKRASPGAKCYLGLQDQQLTNDFMMRVFHGHRLYAEAVLFCH